MHQNKAGQGSDENKVTSLLDFCLLEAKTIKLQTKFRFFFYDGIKIGLALNLLLTIYDETLI